MIALPGSVARPFVIDTQAALDLGCIPATTYANAVGATCDWLVEMAQAGDWREQFLTKRIAPEPRS
jgi:hypothetical protein